MARQCAYRRERGPSFAFSCLFSFASSRSSSIALFRPVAALGGLSDNVFAAEKERLRRCEGRFEAEHRFFLGILDKRALSVSIRVSSGGPLTQRCVFSPCCRRVLELVMVARGVVELGSGSISSSCLVPVLLLFGQVRVEAVISFEAFTES
ncbi:hypothetical protein Bca101_032616 [Brassica carinata]